MSGLCTGRAAVRGLRRDPWAGLRFSWENVEGSQTFRFGDTEQEVPLGQVLERCQREKAAINSRENSEPEMRGSQMWPFQRWSASLPGEGGQRVERGKASGCRFVSWREEHLQTEGAAEKLRI